MRSELLLACVVLTACESPVVIGEERRMSVAALAFDSASGEVLQAGFRTGATAASAQSDLWYARVGADGKFVRDATTVELAGGADAVSAAARLSTGWVVAGHVTRATGERVGWVRRLDDTEQEVWTVELAGRAGTQSEVRAAVVAFDESIVVGGVETQPDGSEDGWLARLTPEGQVAWRVSFAVDFTQQAKGTTVLGLALIPPSINQIYTVGQRTRAGVTHAEGLQLSLAGELFDSHQLGTYDSALAVFDDDLSALTACAADRDGTVHALEVDRMFAISKDLELRVEGVSLELASCAQTPELLWVGATAMSADGTRAPYFARIDKASFTLSDAMVLTEAAPTTALTVVSTPDRRAFLAGRSNPLLRRWMRELPVQR